MRRVARFVALVALGVGSASATDRLGAYPVDPAQVSVAGISSGAFMANQLHIAHSADVMGAAMVAGGLYGCAVAGVNDNGVWGLASQALNDCMKLPENLKSASEYAEQTRAFAAKGWIDPVENLARSKLYFFTGGSDRTVDAETVKRGAQLYQKLGVPKSQIVVVDRSGPAARAGHSWVTAGYGAACDLSEPPYIDNCGYDQAEAELRAIYGEGLNPPAPEATGRIVAFDQTEFVPQGDAATNGLADTGYLYVPKACEPGGTVACRLHVVFHGCKQAAEAIGDVFYSRIGVNEMADANAIVVLYPQAHATSLGAPLALNPMGCWNFWGYSDDEYFPTRKGVQVGAVWKMIERIKGQ